MTTTMEAAFEQAHVNPEDLKKTLTDWNPNDAPKAMKREAHKWAPTNNVTRETYEMVARNPGITIGDLIRNMEARGFKRASVYSLAAAMVLQGMFERREGKYHYAVKPYEAVKSGSARAKLRKAQTRKEVAKARKEKLAKVAYDLPSNKRQQGMTVLLPANELPPIGATVNMTYPIGGTPPEPAKIPVTMEAVKTLVDSVTLSSYPPRLTAEHVLDRMGIKEAKALYDELKKVFG